MDKIKISFPGGAGTVTGSKTLVEYKSHKILIDCGLFQGLKQLRLMNREPFPVAPEEIDAVLLTHAHLDHSGYFPLLVKQGFKGKIYCTEPTRDLTFIILLDSGKIQEEEAELANNEGFSKHHPALPLYTVGDVEKSLRHFEMKREGEWIELFPEVKFCFRHSGHIIGSALIEMQVGGKKLVFSGDLGRKSPLYLYPSVVPKEADLLVMESTYGDRAHPEASTDEILSEIINDTLRKKGSLAIPGFTVERAQELMVRINRLKKQNKIPDVPVFLDSPMAADVTEVFWRNGTWHRLSDEDINDMKQKVVIVRDIKTTYKVINSVQNKIVIAGSGMITGGRILEYLKAWLNNPNNTILLSGYQAEGTRGRHLLEGASEIKIHGKYYPVKAEIKTIGGLSGHAGQDELLDWVGAFEKHPQKILLNHGEPKAALALRDMIINKHALDCEVAEMNKDYEI
ncbi:MBL fold metallo-hydrolase [Cytophagaceae bacterium ABcell3]|nr:MBL fold metallo-hydrolase [Cytophagaceae bacterium ABcell3]